MKSSTQPSASDEPKFTYSPDRESKWIEVKVSSEKIRKFAVDATTNLEITKDGYYEMYNIAVSLLRCIDGLDPDKRLRDNTTNSNSFLSNIANPNFNITNFSSGSTTTDFASPLQSGTFNAESFFPANNYISPLQVPNFYPNNTASVPVGTQIAAPPPSPVVMPKDTRARNLQSNFTGELYLDVDGPTTDPKHKRRRRRTFYAPKRNLHCHMCMVTETPEWRRGPDGDHTLCNACGLHYAKLQKKDNSTKEGKPVKRGKKDPGEPEKEIKSDRISEKEGREEK